ncbi:MAG: hypothetical protein HC769_30170 [Cyanobacteria bacterium CRU_2_1]|nr:hypothetical protein [Cyanobacteria bacterium RU_5_0]NJR62687.1 hypothetical protein [Cyanobacteria bacterium CRU_2_1]
MRGFSFVNQWCVFVCVQALLVSVAIEGNHLGLPCGKVSICEIHIGVNRYLVAAFCTADRLLRYSPTIDHQRCTYYERCHVR